MSAPRTKTLFQEALDLPPAERITFLDGACQDDGDLREDVDALLRAHDGAGDFLESPASLLAGVGLDPDSPVEVAGDTIGGFELVERIGEGGFGVVWRAHQDQPVRRDVAIKVIKLGMDTEEVVARFEREREALAQLNHPHVATVLDAGATGDGRPWFAMELVDGKSVTEHCDEVKADLRARLELFVQICRAIQHAHHNGIIHRDVKPTNVLVSTRDGVPIPRIIDFGIAKAIHASETGFATLSRTGALLGTPEYMSPEQIETWGVDVDARTDVYSLGVLLFELMTGSRPFGSRPGRSANPTEVLREIVDTDPERPSARVEGLAPGEASRIASARSTSPPQLRRALRGEIDWVVLRALEKNRERRYATPLELAADVQRYLRNEAVAAGPPGRVYRFRKFAQRHRTWLGAAVLSLAAIVVGGAFAVDGMIKARAAEATERSARERAEHGEQTAVRAAARVRRALEAIEDLLTTADPRRRLGPDYTVRQMLDEFDARLSTREFTDPEVEARVRMILGSTYRQLGEPDRAEEHARAALRLRLGSTPDGSVGVAESRMLLGWVLQDRGKMVGALEQLDSAIAFWRRYAEHGTDLGAALDAQASVLTRVGRVGEALAALEEALTICVDANGEDHPDTARVLSREVQALVFLGRAEEAEFLARRALDILEAHLPEGHPEILTLRHNLAVVFGELGRWAEAEPFAVAALDARIALHGDGHPNVASSRQNLGWIRHQLGRDAEAEPLLRSGREALRASLGESHPFVTEVTSRLGAVLHALGRNEDAEREIRDAVQRNRTLPGHRADGLLNAVVHLADLLYDRGEAGRAEQELLDGLAVARDGLPDPHPVVITALARLALLVEERGDLAGAERLLEEIVDAETSLWGADSDEVRRDRERLAALRVRRAAAGR